MSQTINPINPITRASTVLATLNYLVPTRERPRNYTYEPEAGTPCTTIVSEPHQVAINDIRAASRKFTLDGDGSSLRRTTAR